MLALLPHPSNRTSPREGEGRRGSIRHLPQAQRHPCASEDPGRTSPVTCSEFVQEAAGGTICGIPMLTRPSGSGWLSGSEGLHAHGRA